MMKEELAIKDKSGRELVIRCGDCFHATDAKRKKRMYKYLGIFPDGCGYDIYLRNETDSTFCNVENEWFAQRKIALATGGQF